MQWPALGETRRNSCWWKNQDRCLPMRRKESKNSIRQTGNCTCVFWRCKAVCCRTGWLDFIPVRKVVSSGNRVGNFHAVAFLLLHDGLHDVCLGLAYLAKQVWSPSMEDLGLFGSPYKQCIWSLSQWLPSCSFVWLCWVPGQHAWSSPDSSGLHQGGWPRLAGCLLPKSVHLASGFPPSCFQAHHANRRGSHEMCVFFLLLVNVFYKHLGLDPNSTEANRTLLSLRSWTRPVCSGILWKTKEPHSGCISLAL